MKKIISTIVLLLSFVALTIAQTTNPSYCDSVKSEIKVSISGTKVSFSVTSTGTVGYQEWIFGDGTSNSKDATPTHDYGKAGTYNPCVYLIIKNPRDANKPCTTKVCKQITVGSNNQDSCANFKPTASMNLGSDGQTVTFEASSSSSNNFTYYWNFGDGTSSTDRTGTHKYKPGTYKPCVIITSTKPRCEKKICFEITVKDNDPCANFNPTVVIEVDSNGVAHYKAYWNGGTISYYDWDFGDNTTSTTQYGTHQYKPGTYKPCVTLTAVINGVKCTKTICKEITVKEKDPCKDFNPKFEYKIGENGMVYFYGASGTNLNFHWSFGDGTSGTGTQTSHQYKPGTYKPCVTISSTNPKCEKKYCWEITIKESDPCRDFNPTFGFSIDGTTVKFEATYGANYTYSWNFNNSGHSSNRIVKFDFKKPGTYKVCVTITDTKTKCTKTICKEIIIKGKDTEDPCKGFNPKVSFQIDGAKVKFGVDGGKGSTFKWSFGDGTSSTDRNPVHVYKKSGKYTVCVTVYDAKRKCKKTICFTIEVTVPNSDPCKDFNPDFSYTVTGNKVTVEASNIKGVQYNWSWGDKTKESSGRIADHTYKVAGKYVLCMTAYDPNTGCKKTICKYIVVGNSRMIGQDDNGNEEKLVVFPNPADTKITLVTLSENPAKIVVKDLNGMELIRYDANPGENKTVDLIIESLPKGTYYINVEQDGKTEITKFLK